MTDLEAITLPQAELARLFGVTSRTVARWTEAGLPRAAGGRLAKYPVGACIRWAIVRQRVEHDREKVPLSLKAEQTALYRARRELAEIELAHRRRELVPFDDARKTIRQIGELLSTRITGMRRYAYRWQACRSQQDADQMLDDVGREIVADLRQLLLDPLPMTALLAREAANGKGRPRGHPRTRSRDGTAGAEGIGQ